MLDCIRQVREERFCKMIRILITLLVLLYVNGLHKVYARKKRAENGLNFADCGMDADRPLRIYDVRANPIPIVTPGTLYVSFKGNLTEDLPDSLSLELQWVKYLARIPFSIPCFPSNIGSCLYENICENLRDYEMGCPKKLRQYGVQCSCPFKAGKFNIRNLPLNIPKVRGYARAIIRVRGDYRLTIRILDKHAKELGCLRVSFGIKKRYKGWLFKI